MKHLIVAGLLALSPLVTNAIGIEVRDEVPHYTMTKTGPGVDVESPWGAWHGYIGTPRDIDAPADNTDHVLEFEFRSEGYFVPENQGHMAIGVRGTTFDGVQGKGVILGNVTGYKDFSPDPCTPTNLLNAVAIESYWTGGNCVYGKDTTSVHELKDRVDYKIKVSAMLNSAGNTYWIRYSLFEKVGSEWVWVDSRSVLEEFHASGPTTNAGWFIFDAGSVHPWKFKIHNLREYWIVK